MVMQYSLSQYFDDVGGDTFMSTVPALNNFASDYTYQAPFIEDHWYTVTLIITIKNSEKNGLLLDQQPIQVFFDFSLTVKAAPHECVIRTGQP